MELINQLINSKFTVLRRIGGGSFGQVFEGRDKDTLKPVAIKLEAVGTAHQYLLYEAKLMRTLQDTRGVPRVRWSGSEGNYNVLVMDLLGMNLGKRFTACELKLITKDLVQVALQLLERLEAIHQKCYIHRDIKPENFTLGVGPLKDLIYIIDFGLAKKYCDQKTRQHVPFRENKGLTGTARYASVNAHLGLEQSRRDDLEAVLYVTVFFMKGNLPWQGVIANTKPEKYSKIMEKKLNISVEMLCKGLPEEVTSCLKYVKSLRFDEEPNYLYLRNSFLKIAERERVRIDHVFEWKQPSNAHHLSVPHQVKRRSKRMKGRRESVLSSCIESSCLSSYEEEQDGEETAVGTLPVITSKVRLAAHSTGRTWGEDQPTRGCMLF